eukprot:TRINITY_DN286_c0_g3_i2.p1 TRINITY_DN286_c0_g3~~TRINITY_DN286_c0_g3_i2.p1  ORF type:complete len:377 (+),score=105.01 TRINITY_DN286_c0_g3_i2:267-1397(+)
MKGEKGTLCNQQSEPLKNDNSDKLYEMADKNAQKSEQLASDSVTKIRQLENDKAQLESTINDLLQQLNYSPQRTESDDYIEKVIDTSEDLNDVQQQLQNAASDLAAAAVSLLTDDSEYVQPPSLASASLLDRLHSAESRASIAEQQLLQAKDLMKKSADNTMTLTNEFDRIRRELENHIGRGTRFSKLPITGPHKITDEVDLIINTNRSQPQREVTKVINNVLQRIASPILSPTERTLAIQGTHQNIASALQLLPQQKAKEVIEQELRELRDATALQKQESVPLSNSKEINDACDRIIDASRILPQQETSNIVKKELEQAASDTLSHLTPFERSSMISNSHQRIDSALRNLPRDQCRQVIKGVPKHANGKKNKRSK